MSELIFYSTPTATVDSVLSNCREMREHDGGAVGRCGVHLSVDTSDIQVDVEYISPWIHQAYTFRHRRVIRTSAESRQEYLTSGKECIEPRKTQ